LFNKKVLVAALVLLPMALAQQTTGTVSGTVLDSQTGRPVAGVQIVADGQTTSEMVTDADGRFSMSISSGTHTLQFDASNYLSAQVDQVVVRPGQNAEASTLLSTKAVGTTVTVAEKLDAVSATAEAMLIERRLSPTVSDSIGRQELASSTASDAAGALEKVTGVSVVGDGFVYVRGLGERYSSTQLNGALVPTTEPEKRVVPLDMFPAGLIENIKIVKTYSPDLPSEFSGGLVQMQTIEFPTSKMFNVSMKSGFNTATTFDRFLTYPGGSSDFFGFGKGVRSIPSSVPSDARLFPGQFTQQQLQSFGKAFSDNWEPTAVNSERPAFDWSAVGGGTFGRFGIVGAASFSNKPQLQSELQRYIRQGAGEPIIFTEYPDYREYSETAKLGAVFNVAVRLTPTQKVIFRNTLTHDSDKTARQFSGFDGGTGTSLAAERLRYVERSLFVTGVEGDHSIPRWHNSLIRWQLTYSNSKRDEPDLREVIRNLLPDGRYIFAASGSSGIRFFSNLNDRIYEPQTDYSIPFSKGPVSGLFKTGVRITVRRRDFGARRFLYAAQQFTTLNLFAPSNQLFGPENIRPNGFQITEFTRGTDSYAAEMNIYAGYAMVDLSLGSRWRMEGGFRIEDADQIVTTVDNRVPNAIPVRAGLQNRDLTPAINAIYAVTARQNFRLSYSRTLSRPDFRELSPFDFSNTLGGFVTQGNPNLKRAEINNYDARWELFSSGNQLIAASVFAKLFTDPIEQTIVPSNDLRQTFVNAQGARNFGFELEFRRSLATFTPRLREFGVSSNFTFVDSSIDIRPDDATIVTSQSRPLLGQSRYIANAILQWQRPKWRSDAKFDANYVSSRITDVGTFKVPDIYQSGNVLLNFVYQYTFDEEGKASLRFEGENLSDNDYRWTQGPFVQRDYRVGRTFQIGFNYAFF
jgi:outer membrane receptor protein involved in Fe transport